MYRFGIVVFLTLSCCPCFAAIYWVDDNGAETTWANCQSESPMSGAACCTYGTANTNADDTDIVYYRAGTYSVSGELSSGIYPSNSGSDSDNVITFSAYDGESVVFQSDLNDQFGLRLSGRDWIKVVGIEFSGFMRGAWVVDANYNEVSYCSFYQAGTRSDAYIQIYIGSNATVGQDSTHNWIHHNTLHTMGNAACGEGGDLLRIGSNSSNDIASNYNTIENNTLYHVGHTLTDGYGQYNVWRNNIGHNEGWKTNPGGCTYPPSAEGNYPGDGKYGHRCFSLTNSPTDYDAYCLFEGNRSGYASANPNNNGADGLSLGSAYNIVRYNFFFGMDGTGIYVKAYSETDADNNRIYNNTVYSAGRWTGSYPANPIVNTSLYITIYSLDNFFKNNLLNNATGGDVTCGGGGCDPADQTWGANLCDATNSDYACTAGSPTFVNTSLADMTSLTLPDLSLQSGSAGIDGGSYLTTVAAGDSSSGTALVLTDVMYFQDGSWGSSLSDIKADWICVGTTVAAAECFQVGAINYSTNTITVTDFTREDGDYVWLYKDSDGTRVLYGTAPDQGAYEYHMDAPVMTGCTISGGLLQ